MTTAPTFPLTGRTLELCRAPFPEGPSRSASQRTKSRPPGTRQAVRSGWFATGFHADTNEDHCVTLCGYGSISWLAQQLGVQVPAGVDGTQPGYAMFTWDSIGIIDVPSMIAITHEAWLRRPTTVVVPTTGGWANWFNGLAGAAAFGSPIPGGGPQSKSSRSVRDWHRRQDLLAWWDAASGWANWFNVSGGAAALGVADLVVARNRNHLDLFVTGQPPTARSTRRGGTLRAGGRTGSTFRVAPGFGVADLGGARNPRNHLDLFVTGTDGKICTRRGGTPRAGGRTGSTFRVAPRLWGRRSRRWPAIQSSHP